MLKIVFENELEDPDFEDFWRRVADLMETSVGENFASGGRPGWEPLSGGGRRMLYASGRLRGSIKKNSGQDFAELTTDTPYAPYHQHGANIPVTAKSRAFFWAKFKETQEERWKWMALSKRNSFRLPASPFFVFQEEDKAAILEEMKGLIKFTEPSTKG